ncbi:hypothetical protein Pmani_017831 [Petrolisthes manimaculis]|uniref:Uncharacterized protein n=1 Tax=Petrolisthes manimaculis TaxID=1843537 RepID=A0AAE1PP87_9EUCA|nr:hypothetical protein Pmani_017831 [Petrolisthes manimaculis]
MNRLCWKECMNRPQHLFASSLRTTLGNKRFLTHVGTDDWMGPYSRGPVCTTKGRVRGKTLRTSTRTFATQWKNIGANCQKWENIEDLWLEQLGCCHYFRKWFECWIFLQQIVKSGRTLKICGWSSWAVVIISGAEFSSNMHLHTSFTKTKPSSQHKLLETMSNRGFLFAIPEVVAVGGS